MDHYKDLLEGCVLTEEYFEKPPNHQILASALVKSKNPRTRNSLSIRIYGVYSLPKKWVEKIGDPNEESYIYEVKVSGIDFKGAKIKQRELTEEEKAEAEALKGKKGGKGKGDEEPLPEEIALKQKIEQNRAELLELSERERFFRINEDPTKSISLQFENPKQSQKLENEHLWEFEDVVNEDNGIFLQLNKIQVPEDDNDPKKKGGKGKPAENLPMFYSKGWIDFTPFITPGKKHTIQRIPLKTCNPPVNEGDENNENQDDEEKEPEPIFEDSQSYIYVHVSTEFAINPSIKPGEEEEPETNEAGQPTEDKPAEPTQNIEDSYIEEEEFVEEEKQKVKINPEVFEEIDSNLGYFADTSDATANYRIIIQKYLK